MAVEQIAFAPRRAERTSRGSSAPPVLESVPAVSYVIGEQLFRDAVIRERKRADRAHESLAMLMLVADGTVGARLWNAAIEAVSSAKRDTDILGWYQHRKTLAVVLADVRVPDSRIAAQIEARIRVGLASRIGNEALQKFSIRVHAHAPADDGVPSFEPLMENIYAARARSDFYDRVKRAADAACAATLLALLSPLMLAIALLVKLKSPGPVLFKQVRVGEKATPFHMLKFRTMHVNSDHGIHQAFVTDLIKGAQPAGGDAKAVFKIANDPRVTPIGHILRKTSLDELPQLWNVVRGDMSLVGPRPPLPYEVDQYKPWHRRRVLEAKPGITGLWQVKGRSRTTFDEMVRLDLRYAKSRSLMEDAKILLATPRAVIAGKGAC